MKLDLRPRCKRPACNDLIRKGKDAQWRWKHYKPYCSYNCQEWHRLESAQEYINTRRAVKP